MPRGGSRPNSGRPKGSKSANGPKKPPDAPPKIPRREFQLVRPEVRIYRMAPGDGVKLTPMQVMQENMEFFHETAAQVMQVIMSLPTGTQGEQEVTQLNALLLLGDLMRLRQQAQDCARQLAPYIHRTMAAVPYKPAEEEAKPETRIEMRKIPTNPKVQEAFARASRGERPQKVRVV